MSNLNVLSSFVQHVLISGTTIACLAVIIEHFTLGIEYSSYLYAALPTVYFYLFWVTYTHQGDSGIRRLNVHLIGGTLLFILFVATTHLMHINGFHHSLCFAVALLVFGLLSWMYFKWYVN